MSKILIKDYIKKEALKESPFLFNKNNSSLYDSIGQVFNEKNKIENIGKKCILVKSNHLNLII